MATAPIPIMERSADEYALTGGTTIADASENFVSIPDLSRARVRGISISEVETKFRRLVGQWRKETEHVSSITRASMHPAYQRIIGMGEIAVPYLLHELEQDPDHWFWALNAITEQDPAQSQDTFDGALSAWLKWGRENGYL